VPAYNSRYLESRKKPNATAAYILLTGIAAKQLLTTLLIRLTLHPTSMVYSNFDALKQIMRALFLLFFSLAVGSFVFAQQGAEGLAVHTKAPDFNTKDNNGNNVSLASLLKQGPVVVLFYRGNWCPYCNKQLKELQDSLQFITTKGASVVAITPEATEGVEKTVQKTGASFPIIYDKGVKISNAYKVSYEVDTATVNKYKTNWDVDFLKINQQEEKAYLPVPAVYIIDKNGTITYRFFETDITKRPSVQELVANL
jgi:peroxiredoxin